MRQHLQNAGNDDCGKEIFNVMLDHQSGRDYSHRTRSTGDHAGAPPQIAATRQMMNAAYRPVSGFTWATRAKPTTSGTNDSTAVRPAYTSALKGKARKGTNLPAAQPASSSRIKALNAPKESESVGTKNGWTLSKDIRRLDQYRYREVGLSSLCYQRKFVGSTLPYSREQYANNAHPKSA